jgi:hypothetical protein
MAEVKKNFRWNITDDRALEALDTMNNLSIVRGTSLDKALTEALRLNNARYVQEHNLQGITLVSEKDLMTKLELQGTSVSRSSLYMHRNKGNLDGMFWQDDEERVVYNLEACLKHYKGATK